MGAPAPLRVGERSVAAAELVAWVVAQLGALARDRAGQLPSWTAVAVPPSCPGRRDPRRAARARRGAPLDLELLGELLGMPERQSADLVARGRSSGWLLTDGELIPLARTALLAETPPELTRALRRRLLGLLVDRGEEPVDLARALAADGIRDRRAARLLETIGSALLTTDPALAGELLAEASAAGTPAREIAARRAHAAVLCGHLDDALQLADTVLVDVGAADHARAAGVTATVLAQRGLLARSAELFRLAGPSRTGSAALALLGTGHPDETHALLDDGEEHGEPAPTVLGSAEELMAQGVLESLQKGPDARCDIAAALSTLTRAAALVEPVARFALLPDTPAALAALVALHCGSWTSPSRSCTAR